MICAIFKIHTAIQGCPSPAYDSIFIQESAPVCRYHGIQVFLIAAMMMRDAYAI
jgi:hypothetical protein